MKLFLDVTGLGGVLAGIAAIATAILGWFKWRNGVESTPVYKAAEGNSLIADIKNKILSYSPDFAIVSICEVTNGGGIPVAGKPLYMRIIDTTDEDTRLVFGEKFMMESNLVTICSRAMLKGDTFSVPEELQSPLTGAWFEAKGIRKTYYFLIGVEDGARVLMLLVNSKSIDLLPQSVYFDLLADARKISQIIAPKGVFKKKLIRLSGNTYGNKTQ